MNAARVELLAPYLTEIWRTVRKCRYCREPGRCTAKNAACAFASGRLSPKKNVIVGERVAAAAAEQKPRPAPAVVRGPPPWTYRSFVIGRTEIA